MSLLCQWPFAMSVLCNCFAYALFLLCVNYLLQTTGTIPTVHIWGQNEDIFLKCIRSRAKGKFLCNPDAVLRTFKITTASPCSLVNASRHRIKIRSVHRFSLGACSSFTQKACFDDLRAFVSEIGSQSVGCITIHARKTHQRDFQRFFRGGGVGFHGLERKTALRPF